MQFWRWKKRPGMCWERNYCYSKLKVTAIKQNGCLFFVFTVTFGLLHIFCSVHCITTVQYIILLHEIFDILWKYLISSYTSTPWKQKMICIVIIYWCKVYLGFAGGQSFQYCPKYLLILSNSHSIKHCAFHFV